MSNPYYIHMYVTCMDTHTFIADYLFFLCLFFTLEKEMATHSNTLGWKNPMDRGAWWAIVHGSQESDTT